MAQRPFDYSRIAQSEKFQALIARKKSFILPVCVFFFVFYFTLPIMTSYFDVLNKKAVVAISWAWIFAFAQFVMTWALCGLYSKRAAEFDRLAAEIQEEVGK